MDKAVELQTDDVAAIAGGDIEDARQALVQKIGETSLYAVSALCLQLMALSVDTSTVITESLCS